MNAHEIEIDVMKYKHLLCSIYWDKKFNKKKIMFKLNYESKV